eukprot:6308825-Karenia_brevis.AAC.1
MVAQNHFRNAYLHGGCKHDRNYFTTNIEQHLDLICPPCNKEFESLKEYHIHIFEHIPNPGNHEIVGKHGLQNVAVVNPSTSLSSHHSACAASSSTVVAASLNTTARQKHGRPRHAGRPRRGSQPGAGGTTLQTQRDCGQ